MRHRQRPAGARWTETRSAKADASDGNRRVGGKKQAEREEEGNRQGECLEHRGGLLLVQAQGYASGRYHKR